MRESVAAMLLPQFLRVRGDVLGAGGLGWGRLRWCDFLFGSSAFRANGAHVRLLGIKDGGGAATPSTEATEETHWSAPF